MNMETFYTDLKSLESDLLAAGFQKESEEVRDAVAYGSTGGEIVMHVRSLLVPLEAKLKSNPELKNKVSKIIHEINKTGW
jgi:hypothetical protein